LANETFKAMKEKDTNIIKYDIVGQANHGVCAIGPNPWDAFEHIERLEHICEIVLKSGVKPPKYTKGF
jgi:L-fuculose-phosphate aldolase